MKLWRRIRWTWVWWAGNLYRCNRAYWGWVSLATAWRAAKPLEGVK